MAVFNSWSMPDAMVFGASGIPFASKVVGVMKEGGVLGAVAGLVAGGIECLDMHQRGVLNGHRAVNVLGRDISNGVVTGMTAATAAAYVTAAASTVGAVISAPAWVPATAGFAAMAGVGYVANRVWMEAWEAWWPAQGEASQAQGQSTV